MGIADKRTRAQSFSIYNPANWTVKIAVLERIWKAHLGHEFAGHLLCPRYGGNICLSCQDFHPEVWLRLVPRALTSSLAAPLSSLCPKAW